VSGWRHGALRRCRRNRERQPGVPARWPVGRIEFAIAFQVQVSLHVSNRENKPNLRTDPEYPGPEATKDRAPADVVGDLLIGISNKTDKDLFREKLRCTPVEMKIDAALNLRIRILEVLGTAADARNFVSRCRVKVGVAAAAVDGTVTDANVGEAVRIVGADGNIAGHVSHVIMNARVPLQRHHRIQVAERCERV
jgi:hypothetical protein